MADRGVRAKVDARTHLNPGNKYYEWERKGVPLRMEIGPRDMEQQQVVLAKRVRAEDDPRKEFLPEAEALATISERLDAFQGQLLEDAIVRREQNSYRGV